MMIINILPIIDIFSFYTCIYIYRPRKQQNKHKELFNIVAVYAHGIYENTRKS